MRARTEQEAQDHASRGALGLSTISTAVATDRRAAFGEKQRQSFADLYVAAQRCRLYDDKTVSRRRNRDMRFILGNGPAGD